MRRALDLFTVSTMDAVKSGVTEAVVSTSYVPSAVWVCLKAPVGFHRRTEPGRFCRHRGM